MKRILTIFCLALPGLILPALALNAQMDNQAIAAIAASSASIRSLECEFEQTKHSTLLENDLVSKGRMSYSYPDNIRWEYTSPYTYAFVMEGGKAMMLREDGSGNTEVRQNRAFKELARLMTGFISGSSLADDKLFSTTVEETPAEWVATLVPRKKEMKQLWTSLILHLDKSSSTATTIILHESSGDTTTIRFFSVKKQ